MNTECGICMEEIKSKDMFKTKCGHNYHNCCITQWLLPNSSCPICRKQLIKDGDVDEDEDDDDDDDDDETGFLMYVWDKNCKPKNEETVMNYIEEQIAEHEEDNSDTLEYTLESNIRIKENNIRKILYYNINKIRQNSFVVDVFDFEIKLNYRNKFYRSKSKYKLKRNNNYLKRSTKCNVLSF